MKAQAQLASSLFKVLAREVWREKNEGTVTDRGEEEKGDQGL